MVDDLIITEENEDLFDTEGKDKKDDFEPPPLLNDETTPVIRFMTPVRRKKKKHDDEESEDGGPSFLPPEPIPVIPIRTPQLDLSDDDDVNMHVRNLVSRPGEYNYDKEPEKVQNLCLECFKIKFQNLTINYPDYNIEFPEGKSLNKIHKFYHELIKSIYVNMNISQYETYYMLGLLAVELIAVQVFNLPMSGYTEAEMKRMYRYRSLLIELGESFYPDGSGEQSSIEWRVFSSMGWNIIIFLAVKVLADWIGGEDMVDMVRQIVDQLIDNPITQDNIESGEAKNIDSGNINMLGDMFGGGDMKNIISGLGTMFTKNAEGRGKKTKREKRERVVFGN